MKNLLRLNLLFCFLILTSVGWAKAETGDPLPDLPEPFTQAIIDQTDLANLVDGQQTIGIFANGHPVDIELGEDGNIQLNLLLGGIQPNVIYQLDPEVSKHIAVFGGGYDNEELIDRTYVTLKKGVTIGAIVGGSYGTEAGKGKVNEANISLGGGTVLKYVVGGGVLYSETTSAGVGAYREESGETVTVNGWLIPCMESGQTQGTAYGEYENSPCKVGNMEWSMSAGTYKYIGVAGGNGNKACTNTASASIHSATITGGIFGCGSNGRGASATINLSSCIIGDGSESPVEIAAVNRGLLGDFAISFDNCTYNATNKYHFNAGATYDWSNGGKQLNDEHRVTGKSQWSVYSNYEHLPELGLSDGLEGDLSTRGFSVAAREFIGNSKGEPTKVFEIPSDKEWNFSGIFSLYSGVTIEKKGVLSVGWDWNVSSVEQLRFAQECMENGRTISLQTGTYLLSSPLVIDKELTLEGNGSIWEADPSAAWPADKSDLITVEAESTISIWLNNLTVQKSKGAGICAKTAQKVYMNNVTLKDNETAGLIVLAAVNAEGLHTSGNKWGGVYLDKSESTTEDGKFRFYAGCTYEEDLQIWAYSGQEHIESSFAVFCPDNGERWYDYNFRNEEDRYIWLWTNTKRNVKVTQETIDGFTYVYANGYYAKVTQSETDASKVVIEVDYSDIVESESDKTILFGGCKDYPASHSYISIEGGKIHTVYGGGWGQTPEKSADVKSVHINMNGGEVSHLMIGGGKGYARSGKLEVRIYDGNGVINEFYPGGDAEGITGNTLTTPLEEAYNRMEEVDVRIESGTIRQALGLGGGLGLTHTGKSTIFIEDITLGGIYGASANGHADKIYAQFRNCKFEGGANTIATLNKGMIGNIQIDLYDNQYADGFEAYLGAAPGWGNTYTAGEPAPEVTGGVSYHFQGDVLPVRLGEGLTNANVGIGNAPVVIGKFFRGEQLPEEEQYIDVFEIGADKQWVLDKNSGFDSEHPASLVIKGRLDMFPSWYYNLVATSTSLLVVPERNMTMADFLSDFNWANNGHPMDLSDKSLVFDCTDGAIVSNKSLAKQWMATGKNVQLLQYNADAEQRKHYSLAYIDPNETLRITNLPDAVSYGTAPIELAFNQEGVTASITAGGEFAKIENGKLTVLKPGEVKITLTTDEESETVTQDLKITKRILTLTGGLTASEKVYDGTTDIDLTKGEYAFTGLVGEKTVSFVNDPTGVLVDANAGDNKQVTVTAALADGMDAFYELAPISFVTAKVTPKPIEIKANDVTVKYGETIPFGTNDYQASLIGEDKLEGELKYSCTQTSSAQAAVYADAITPYGLSSQNYQITYKSGSLKVEAFGPSIEIMEHKIVKEGVTTKIEMKAKLNHNGGDEIDKVTFAYKQEGMETSITVAEVTEKMEVYTASYPNMAAGNYELKVTAYNRAGHSGAASIPVTVDEKTPQNLTWDASVLSTMVYGQEMTLSASSDQTAATGELLYSITTYDLGKAEFADPSRNIIKATKEGEFMITAKRAEDPNYSPALVEKKVVVVQKPITVEVGEISQTYDGTTSITNVPKFTLSGVEAGDNVAVDVVNLTLKFASKNAGVDIPVILPELKLTGADAGNYVLVQPKNVTGTINQKDLKIKVKDLTRTWNQKYTKYEFETEGLIAGETLADAYQGQLVVTEVGDNLVLSVEDDKCPNYLITPISGSLTITKGTPVAVVYGSGSYWNGLIVDYQGYSEDEIEIQENSIQQTGQAIVVTRGDNPREIARSINSKPTTTRSAMRAAFGLRAEISSSTYPHWDNIYGVDEIPYGSAAISFQKDGYSYQSTNTSILNFVDDGTNVTVTPVGVGDAAILATKGTEVKVWRVKVTPRQLTLSASMNKGYDGSTVATGTVSLSSIVSSDVVDLDLAGVSFHFINKDVATDKPILPSQPLVLTGTHANNYTFDIADLKGDITTKAITIGNPLTVYYNGSTEHELTSYPVSGLVAGDVEPIKVTLKSANVGLQPISTNGLTLASKTRNYTISIPQPKKVTVQRSTLVVTLPNTAFSEADLLSHVSLTILETGETVTVGAVDFRPMITTVGSGASAVYSVTGGDTDNYAVMYSSNQVGQTAAPVTPGSGTGGGGTVDPDPVIPTVSNPVVAERTATTAAVTWEKVSGATSYKLFLYAKKTDSTPLKIYEFDKDGKLKATAISFTLTGLEEGKAYYVETAAYNALGTLLVKKSVELSATPTGIEAISEGSQLYTVKGAIVVAPAEPLQVAIYSVTGQTLFNDEVSYLTQVPAKAGIYVVVIQKGNDRITEKVFVK